jgi:hypothetical protein
MAKTSTSEIVAALLTPVAPQFRDIPDVASFQALLSYRTVTVQDEASNLSRALPDAYKEQRLYVMEGPTQLASIDLAFHRELGLVNYSYFVIPREWFKRKAIMSAVRTILFPYLRQQYPDAPMIPQTDDVYLFPDEHSGITFQVRAYTNNPSIVGIGVAMIDSKHV